MFIALTGLHKAGKSYFTNNIPTKYGFNICNKKAIIEQMCYEQTGSRQWNDWFAKQFAVNPQYIINQVLDRLPDGDIILDAVHSNLEWEIIKQRYPNAILTLITSFEDDRIRRWNNEIDMNEQNNKRINFWHNPLAESQCLLANVSWSFNGSDTLDHIEESFVSLIQLLKSKENEESSARLLIRKR